MKKRQKTHPDPTIRTLWGIAKSPELCLSSEELHLVVQVQTGKDSLRQLTKKEIARVAYVLGNMKDSAAGGKKPRTPAASGTTGNQMKKLRKLQEVHGWESRRLNGLCRKMFKVDSPEWLNYIQMSKLIEAVKAIAEREAGKEQADEGLQDHPDGAE